MAPRSELNQMRIGCLKVSDSAFPPDMLLDWHRHDTAIFAVFLHGSMEVQFRRRRFECRPTAVQVHPAGELHRQLYGRTGARILVVQPDARDASWAGAIGAFLSVVHNFEDDRILGLARRARAELAARDDVTPLALQSLAFEMLAIAARRSLGAAGRSRPPWLSRATELVHEEYRGRLRLPDIAAEVGVHPGHLARAFREHHHESLGSYVRRLRLDWAARQLVETSEALSDVALGAGFSDQSHLTRAFKRHTGLTPGRYRDMRRS
jgi:AraC family transcriptional regulator